MEYLRRKFKYGKMLLFWPMFGLVFLLLERFRVVPHYIATYCRLDDYIPFNEWFIFPYMFWFVYLIGMVVYTFFFSKEDFVRLMKYLIFVNTVALIVFIVFPTCQNLRPAVFPRDNLLSRFVGKFYLFDTNTNVAPSLHVLDSLAVATASRYMKQFRSRKWQIIFNVLCFLICISTVFLKQHSVVDILVAVPICMAAEYFAYGTVDRKKSVVRV